MSIAWPATVLPTAIPIDGFSHKRQSAGERTDMESGLARFRLTNRNPLRVVQIGWHMTQQQVEYFNAWMEYRARYGGAWFSIDLPLDGELRTVLARFVGDGQEQKPWRRTQWGITAQLEVRDTNVITPDVFDVVEAYGLTGVQEADAIIEPLSAASFYTAWATFGLV